MKSRLGEQMIIRVVSLAVAGVLALAGVAVATHKGAKVYKTDLAPIGTATATGKAKLVDSQNNKVKVKVKGLTPGVTYPWHLHAGATCAPAGDIVVAFEPYGELTANAAGNASARAKSDDFDTAGGYSVNVHDPAPPNPPIACGVLERKGPQGEAKGHEKGAEDQNSS
jgi:Cu/Zn superoxide dismutase